MAANTGQLERLIGLSGDAIFLTRQGNRSAEQVEEVISALQKFKDEPKPKKAAVQINEYPGRFGNRCNGCGGYIDEGGTCNCRSDHWDHNL